MNKKRVIKEIYIYLVVFVLSAFIMHYDKWLSDPITHIKNLLQSGDATHPLLYSFAIYLVIFILRFVFGVILKLFKR